MADFVTVNNELQLAKRYVEQTGVSLFLTGKAGTGKTTFLHDIDAHCNKRHVVLAPTGVAAVNAGGVTIHSFFQLPFDPYLPDVKELVTEYQMPDSHKSLSKTKINIIRTLELLIIDEISMVRADLLDAIDMTLRRYRRNSRPFGGVQLLMIGDVHQLAPVVTDKERPFMEQVYPTPYFFSSKALQRLQYVTIELTTVYRQQDKAFVDLLNHVRTGNIDTTTLNALNSRYAPLNTNIQTPSASIPITLTTHNRQADAINRRHMEALTGECRVFRAEVRGNFPDGTMPVDERLEIKVGERVMLVKNDTSGAHRYYNGKLATVTGFTHVEDKDYIEVIDDDGDIINVGHEVWENLRYTLDSKSGEISQEVEGTFSQYPLRPAWAVTIHKAQGLTFDRVSIDAADAFAFGQVYVALSRCRSLEGLTLTTPLTAGVAFSDSGVERFVDSLPSYEQVCREAADHEARYYYEQLADLFNLDSLLVEAERTTDIYNRLKNIYPQNVSAMQHLRDSLAELTSVSERFRNQLLRLTPEQHTDRIAKACAYYLPQFNAATASLGVLLDVDIDNKETRQQLKEAGDQLADHLGEKTACLQAVQDKGFSVALVQQAKADHLLGHGAKKEKAKKEPRRKAAKSAGTATASPEGLVTLLKQWRAERAAEENLPAYTVLQQKALLAIATNMPKDYAELKKQLGVGPKTVEKYGKALLDIVADYLESQGITS